MASRRHSEADMQLIRSARKNLSTTMDIMRQLGDDGVDDDTGTTPTESGVAVATKSYLIGDGDWMPQSRDDFLEEKYEAVAQMYGRWTPHDAHYFGADKNPFKADGIQCSNCVFYRYATPDVGVCEIVHGVVDAGGICKLWIIPDTLRTDVPPADEVSAEMNAEADDMEMDDSMKAMRDRATTPAQRKEMPAEDFVFPETRNFPIVTPGDVMPAVHSWGRYRGERSFDEFKTALTALAKRKGAEFYARLPQAWQSDATVKNMNVNSQNPIDAIATIDEEVLGRALKSILENFNRG